MDGSDVGHRRKALGVSRERVAAEAGCSLSSVALIERGYRPGSQMLERVMEALSRLEVGVLS